MSGARICCVSRDNFIAWLNYQLTGAERERIALIPRRDSPTEAIDEGHTGR
jgi:hypothetical protein